MNKLAIFVPIKLNSERFPNKMRKYLGGKYVCAYIFETLLNVKEDLLKMYNVPCDIYCFCSDPTIAQYLPNGIKVLQRDTCLDNNMTKGIEIYKSFAEHVDSQFYMLCHATSPLISKESILSGLQKVLSLEYDSAFSAHAIKTFCWYKNKPINYALDNVVRTQELEPILYETSAFFIYSKDTLANGRRIGNNPYIVYTNAKESIDIDYAEDLEMACFYVDNK